FRCVGVTGAAPVDDHYRLELADGSEERTRYLLIATGVVDDLPGVRGFEECYGRSVFHCPYCDGWEWRDARIAAFGRGRHGIGLALGLRTWSRDTVLCTNGEPLGRHGRDRLARNGIAIRTESVARLEHQDGRVTAIAFDSADRLARDVVFFTTGQHPQSELATRLGFRLTHRGTVRTSTDS